MSCEFCLDCKARKDWEQAPEKSGTGDFPCSTESCPVTDSWWGKYVVQQLGILKGRIAALKSEIDADNNSIRNLHKKLEETRSLLEEKTSEVSALRGLSASAKIFETLDRFDVPVELQRTIPDGSVSAGIQCTPVLMKDMP